MTTSSIKAVNIVRITPPEACTLAKRAIKKPPRAIYEEILYYPDSVVNLNHFPEASSPTKIVCNLLRRFTSLVRGDIRNFHIRGGPP